MAQTDKGVLAAGVVLMDRGMDSTTDPRLLAGNISALLVNSTVRGGFARNRPGWKKVTLAIESDIEEAATTGRFQGAAVFTPRGVQPCLVASIGGRQFRYNVWDSTVTVQEVTALNDPNPSNMLQVWWTQAEDWLLMQDGLSSPWCYDGAHTRRLVTGELPTGTVMEYGLGRVIVASPDGLSFIAGDLVGSSSGSSAFNYRDAVLKTTENSFLNGGGTFSVPFNSGGITSIRTMAVLDSSLGQGPVQVFTSNGAFSLLLPFDRTTWQNLNYPIQSVSMASPGAVAQDSTQNVNGDLWYRSLDGIRSYFIARRDFSQWGNLPESGEVAALLDSDTSWMLGYSSSALFANRLLTTATPTWDQDHGVYHQALAVLDFDILSAIAARVGPEFQPAWDGMWTGLNIFKLVTSSFNGIQRCFAFTWSGEEIELYELVDGSNYDNDGSTSKRIVWGFETRLFDFGTPNSLKRLERADVAPSNIEGTVDFEFKFRSDENPCWLDWSSFQLCSTQSNCAPTECWTPSRYQKSFRSRVTLPSPPDTCSSSNGLPARNGTRHQVRVKVTGPCSLKQLVLYSRTLQEAPFNGCEPSTAVCTEETCCPEDNYFQSV